MCHNAQRDHDEHIPRHKRHYDPSHSSHAFRTHQPSTANSCANASSLHHTALFTSSQAHNIKTITNMKKERSCIHLKTTTKGYLTPFSIQAPTTLCSLRINLQTKRLDEKNTPKRQTNPSPLNSSKTPDDAIAHENPDAEVEAVGMPYRHTAMSLIHERKRIMGDANIDADHVNQRIAAQVLKDKKKTSRDTERMVLFMSHCTLNNVTKAKQPTATNVPVTSGLLRKVLNGSRVFITCPITVTFVSFSSSSLLGPDILGSG